MEKEILIERVFENDLTLKLEDIVYLLFKEKVENKLEEIYSSLNCSSSLEEEI